MILDMTEIPPEGLPDRSVTSLGAPASTAALLATPQGMACPLCASQGFEDCAGPHICSCECHDDQCTACGAHLDLHPHRLGCGNDIDLLPPYSTIVVDPPWHYAKTNPDKSAEGYQGAKGLPYGSMSLDEIKALPVGDLTVDGRCFLWATNRYLRHAWDVLEAWGFEVQDRTLVWCKPPRATTPVTTEFVLMGRKGNPPKMPWHGTTWFQWGHTSHHSAKPAAFGDLVESWCPGPYVELFARAPRLGWDSWGKGYESAVAS